MKPSSPPHRWDSQPSPPRVPLAPDPELMYGKGTAAQTTALAYELGQGCSGESGQEQTRVKYLQSARAWQWQVLFAMTCDVGTAFVIPLLMIEETEIPRRM